MHVLLGREGVGDSPPESGKAGKVFWEDLIMEWEILPAYDLAGEIKILFDEYTEMLASRDSAFREYLAVQRYDEELEQVIMTVRWRLRSI